MKYLSLCVIGLLFCSFSKFTDKPPIQIECSDKTPIVIDPVNYTFIYDQTIQIERQGHVFTSVTFVHSLECPCMKDRAYIPGIY